jgi:hypothetical protein
MGGYWYRCAHCGKWCGRPGKDNINIPPDDKVEIDHIIPWSRGGSDNLTNLQALCKKCNRNKSATPTLSDNIKNVGNVIHHPVDTLVGVPIRKAVRQNKTLKALGLNKRK